MSTGSREVKKLYLYLGLTLLAVALVSLAWSLWPLPAKQQSLTLSPTQLQALFPDVQLPGFLLQESRQLELSYPAVLRLGDTGLLTLSWITSAPAAVAPAATSPHALIETRLDLVGIFQNPSGSIDAPIFPGQTLVLERQIMGIKDGTFSGTLWSYINPTPFSSTGSSSQPTASAFQPVAAQNVELQIISLFGLDFFTARSMGATCLVFSIGLMIYAFFGKSRKGGRKRLLSQKK